MASALPVNGVMNPLGIQQPCLAGQGTAGGVSVQDKSNEWQKELLMEKLRAKASTFKPLVETAKTLRMAMLDKRFAIDSVEKAQLQKSLDALQHSIKVTSLQSMIERLESLSRQLGLKFMVNATQGMPGSQGAELFISSDMFYLEVLLESSGVVKDVKIHHEGKTEQQSCEELITCLSAGDFVDFTMQLEGLASIYQLNADKKVKCKAFSALQSLEMDLGILAQLQTWMKDPFNLVHKSPVGILERRKGGHAMKLTYFVSPYDLVDLENKSLENLSLKTVISKKIGHSVTVCMEGSTAHKLPTSSIITLEMSPTGKNTPSYAPLTNANSSMLPACFVLKLAVKMPMCLELLHRIQKVTELECTDVSTPSPLLSMIVQHGSNLQSDCRNNKGLYVALPDQQHCYFMTENKNMDGVLVSSIPFTHPVHVPQILIYLRQQALFNNLITSCVRSGPAKDLEHINIFEVSALSWQCISVNFEHPSEETMATAELDLTDISALKCKLYGVGATGTSRIAELGGKVLQKSSSIPIMMRAIIKAWESRNSISNSLNINGNFGRETLSHNGTTTSHDFNSEIKIKQESGAMNGQLNGRQQQHIQQQQQSFLDAGAENSIGFPSYSGQSDTTAAMLNPLQLGALLGQASTPGSSSGESSKSKKSRKRKVEGAWRSPKQKCTEQESSEILLDSSSSDSTPLGTPTGGKDCVDNRTPTPTSASGLDLSNPDPLEILSTDKSSDYDLETESEIMEIEPSIVNILEDNSASGIKRSDKKCRRMKSPTIISFEDNKTLVSPSVSITPISSSGPSNYNMLSNMVLEKRPGIEIIPLSISQASLPSSITITAIPNANPKMGDERKDRKLDEKSKLDKKKRRKRDDSPMGPPMDPLTKPVSVTIKPSESPPGSHPSSRPSSPATNAALRKFSPSPTHPNSLVGKSSPTTLKHSPVYNSPKHMSSSVSPKHSQTSSPKHGSSGSVGKPSMSALKSATSSPSHKGNDAITITPKSKMLTGPYANPAVIFSALPAVTLTPTSSIPKIDKDRNRSKPTKLSDDLQISSSGGSTTPPSDFGKSVSTAAPVPRSRKGSLISAVIDKLSKNAQHCTEDSGSGTASKPTASSSSPTMTDSPATPTSAGHIKKLPVSSGSDSSTKTYTGLKPGVNSGPASKKPQTQISSKIRSPSPLVLVGTGSGKSHISGQKISHHGLHKSSSIPNVLSGSVSKSSFGVKVAPRPKKTDIFDLPPHLLEGRRKLDLNYQIPKLSARTTNVEDKPAPENLTILDESNRLVSGGKFGSTDFPQSDKDPQSSGSLHETSELLCDYSPSDETDLEMKSPSLQKNNPPSPPPPPPPPPPDALSTNFAAAAAVPLSTVLASIPSSVSPISTYPASPSVSLHIVKSPASSPRIVPSPNSVSPCITDDELMDEALVGS